jgi:hypothetical protein
VVAAQEAGERATTLTRSQVEAILRVPYLSEGMYGDLDVAGTLEYMRRRFVAPLQRHVAIGGCSLADCAAGFGWLSFAYLFAGGQRAVLVDVDAPRLDAALRIARILELEDRCEVRVSTFQDAKLGADSVDIFATVETLEHVGRANIPACVDAMVTAAKQAVLLTTPNRFFPVVGHDTRLPFAHWLPAAARRRYARAFGRAAQDEGNDFLSPADLRPLARKFRPASAYQTFGSYAEFRTFYPHYLPYGPAASRHRRAPRSAQAGYVNLVGRVLGNWAFAASPNLMSIWLRRDPPTPRR